jgi:hypothetical protein
MAFIYGSVCITSCECAIYCAVSIDCSLDWSRSRLVCVLILRYPDYFFTKFPSSNVKAIECNDTGCLSLKSLYLETEVIG